MKVVNQFGKEEVYKDGKHPITVMLLGGINEDDDWRDQVIDQLYQTCYLDNQGSFKKDLVVYNPEVIDESHIRANDETNELIDKITWDYDKLMNSDIKAIYLSETSSQSLSMFELGYIISTFAEDDIDKLVISINSKFRRNKELMNYLRLIFDKRYIDINIFINDKATPASHALAIYTKYKQILTKLLL